MKIECLEQEARMLGAVIKGAAGLCRLVTPIWKFRKNPSRAGHMIVVRSESVA